MIKISIPPLVLQTLDVFDVKYEDCLKCYAKKKMNEIINIYGKINKSYRDCVLDTINPDGINGKDVWINFKCIMSIMKKYRIKKDDVEVYNKFICKFLITMINNNAYSKKINLVCDYKNAKNVIKIISKIIKRFKLKRFIEDIIEDVINLGGNISWKNINVDDRLNLCMCVFDFEKNDDYFEIIKDMINNAMLSKNTELINFMCLWINKYIDNNNKINLNLNDYKSIQGMENFFLTIEFISNNRYYILLNKIEVYKNIVNKKNDDISIIKLYKAIKNEKCQYSKRIFSTTDFKNCIKGILNKVYEEQLFVCVDIYDIEPLTIYEILYHSHLNLNYIDDRGLKILGFDRQMMNILIYNKKHI